MKPKKNNRKTILAAGIVLGTVVVLFIAIAVMYLVTDERSQEKFAEKECKRLHTESFRGTVRSVEKFEYNQHMNESYFGLNVELNDTSSVNYMFKKDEYADLETFVNPNDHLIKPAGTDSFIIVKSDGIAKHFVLPECGDD